MSTDVAERLTAYFRTQHPEVDSVRVEGLSQVEFGFSAEMLLITLVLERDGVEDHRELVVRLRPAGRVLLEPYDLGRQAAILKALETAPVPTPAVPYLEETGAVLGQPFLVMERLPGQVYEMESPTDAPQVVRRMCLSLVEQLAALHRIDVRALGLTDLLGDGSDFLTRELDHWAAELERYQRGDLPGLNLLLNELRAQLPVATDQVCLVHGDAKPGNFAFADGEVSAIFDWELTRIGDPLADLGYLEVLWLAPVGLPVAPGALSVDELVDRYAELSGIEVHDRAWYVAFQAFKIAVITVLGARLVEDRASDDVRYLLAASGVPMLTALALGYLGVTDEPDPGPYTASPERQDELGFVPPF